ncbi:hypothetical protein B0H16DRAFT_1335915 [Mycena metata]|uniref:MYND-type domain-containing protein n=1 Tax=Mycena metata TaxID=1033252 RepID=A0AAD7MKB0_9AGAR|nr:hypothetical protein B0H16DRAFT_1335915 [Mycena metata]
MSFTGGLCVPVAVKELLERPGYFTKADGGAFLREFYIKESVKFDPFKLSRFAQAVFCGHYDLVKQAVDNGVSPDLTGTETPFLYGYATILVLGAQRIMQARPGSFRFSETLELLLSRGVPANIADILGCTVLHHSNSLLSSNKGLFQCLLRHCADPARRNRFGEVCLVGALHHGNLSMLSVLLDVNVDFTLEDADGYSAWKHFPTCGSQVVAMVMKWDRKRTGTSAAYEDKVCDNCGERRASLKICSRCKLVRYCSVCCQAAQWAHHRTLCKPFSTANSARVVPYFSSIMTSTTAQQRSRLPAMCLYPESAHGLGTAVIPMAQVPKDLVLGPKTLVVKIQVACSGDITGMADLMVYTKKHHFACMIRRCDGVEGYQRIKDVIRSRGPGGLKAYFVAVLLSEDCLLVRVSDVLAEQQW